VVVSVLLQMVEKMKMPQLKKHGAWAARSCVGSGSLPRLLC
jgi:hypothetical protein